MDNEQKEKKYILIFNDNEYETDINKLDKILLLTNYIIENPTLNKIKINNLLEIEIKEELILFILNYAELYPKDKDEELILSNKNNSRNIKNLLNNDEFNLFNSLLSKLEIKQQIDILLKLSELCEILKMYILLDKNGQIISMFIRDKPISFIKDIIKSNDYNLSL